jgi:alkylhydroperoxidase family enzyme
MGPCMLKQASETDKRLSALLWNESAKHYNEAELAELIISIALINVWNRLNRATRQIAASG